MHGLHEPGRAASGLLAVVVHVLFFGVLIFGISWQKEHVAPVFVEYWQADAVEPEPAPKPRIEPKPAPPPKKLPEAKPVRTEAAVELPKPVAETPKPSQADIELKEKQRIEREAELKRQEELKLAEAEKRRLEEEQVKKEQERKRKEEELKKAEQEKRKLEEEARRKAEEQRLKLEEAQRAEQLRIEAEQRKVEQERLRVEEEQRKAEQERLRRERELAEKKRREEAVRLEQVKREREAKEAAAAAARAKQQALVDDFISRIRAKVRSKVVMPQSLKDNPEALYEVTLLPGGDVLQANLKKSSGVPAYDDAVGRAIMASQPLPVPDDPNLFQEHFRKFNMSFRPKE